MSFNTGTLVSTTIIEAAMVSHAPEWGKHASPLCRCCGCELSVAIIRTNQCDKRGAAARLMQSNQVELCFFRR